MLPFDFCFIAFYGPALLWNFYLGKFSEWGWCAQDGGNGI